MRGKREGEGEDEGGGGGGRGDESDGDKDICVDEGRENGGMRGGMELGG